MGVLGKLRKSVGGGGPKKEKKGWNEKVTIDGYIYYYNNESEQVTWEKPKELMNKEELEMMSGAFVFVPHPTKVWQPAKMVKDNGNGTFDVQTYPDGKKETVKKGVQCDGLTAGRSQKVPLWDVKLSSLRIPEDDLVMLDDQNEGLIIHNLGERYKNDELYTWVGASRSVLISINPYKQMNLYGPEAIELHRTRPPNSPLPPHVFDIANDSYESMMFENRNQSVLISGESGAGKTVCTKQVLDFLASVAGSSNKLEDKILACNPMLEAFGNAQTIRNNNSSRFGKWIEIHFDSVEKAIRSASITNYLLEKSRVVRQQANSKERNYHIFYQLCKDSNAKKTLQLGAPSEYKWLKMSGTYDAKDINDVEEHSAVRAAMDLLEFTKDEIESVMRLTAGVLNIGQVDFNAKQMPGRVEGSEVANKDSLKRVSELLEVDIKALETVLTSRSISVKGKTAVIPLTPEKATNGAEALAMGVYSRLFSWLVKRVNDALEGPTGKMIGILDIFGFEIFENNSFEQLCINYCNEKLQQQFNQTTFKEEEALYRKEGIDFKHIEFIDNQIVLDLIEAKPNGLMLMIDDETIVPEGQDSKFMNKAEQMFAKHPKFQTDKNRKLTDKLNFEIEHYAGVVNYNADGFMAKNLDTLFQDLYDLCSASKNSQMQLVFPKQDGRRQLQSLGKQFRGQLSSLMQTVQQTESRYIRCIKPNGEQKPDRFEAPTVIDQLRYSGVFEAVDIRRQGFPFRLNYAQFACRYSCINRKHRYAKKKSDPVGLCKEILAKSKQDFGDVKFGKTLLLYRSKEYKILQLLRNLALETLIPKAQGVMRGHLTREFARRLRKAEAGIKAAIKKGNDLAMMEKALEEVEPTVGTLRQLFDYQPRNLSAGKAHLAGLYKWLELEKKLEKLVKSDPNKEYYALAEAVDSGVALRKTFDFPTKKQEELIEKAIQMRANSDLGKIDAKADEIKNSFDREALTELVSKADGFKHSTPVLKEIKRLLSLPMREWYELEIPVAEGKGDKNRVVACKIELKALILEEDASKYKNLASFPGLKDPLVYAKGAAFLGMGKDKLASGMLVHSKQQKVSLTVLCDPADKVAAKQAEKTAANCAKLIRQFMGDAATPAPPMSGAALLREAKSGSKELQNEVYLQIIKQLEQNPNPDSLLKGFELLLAACGCFAPSEEAERFVCVFLKSNALDSIPYQKYISALNDVIYGGKGVAPSGDEFEQRVTELKESEGSRFSTKRKNRKSARKSTRN